MQRYYRDYGSRIVALPDKPEETPEAAVKALWLRAAGQPVSVQRAAAAGMTLPALNEQQLQEFGRLFKERISGVPLAHLTGRQNFMGLELIASKAALIPRKETELLGEAARRLLTDKILVQTAKPRVLDLCCGSGNVSCAIAMFAPAATVYAADLSAGAVDLARENARMLGCESRTHFAAGDLFAAFNQSEFLSYFDLITCNPPYISTGKLATMPGEIIAHEPKLAFDGGPMGVGVVWRLLNEAPRYLKPGGWLVFEAGLGQGKGLVQRLSRMKEYSEIEGIADNDGNVRVISAKVLPQNQNQQ